MLHSACGRSSNSGQQRRTSYSDDIPTQQKINLLSSQPVLNYSRNQLPIRNKEQNQSCANHRYIIVKYKQFC